MGEDTAMAKVAVRGKQADGAPSNLPHHLTSFVGREAELRSLKEVLGRSRMVTLTGTGGAGKSRLAAEVAKANVNLWPDGVWWIELSGTDDVSGAVVAILELPGRGSAQDVVASWLAARKALLVLDNCEHLVADCATFSQRALERCTQLNIIATSREPLGVPGEARWPVASLRDPDAIQLFEARARLVSPGFKMATGNLDPVTRICERLDRLPLAIEMAAARIDVMSEQELLSNLNDRFRFLTSGTRTAPQRQQTMAAAIDWSYRLLTDHEARLFRRLAVFQGGFKAEGAEAVCSDGIETNLIDVLARLVQKSMVVADRLDSGTRFRLLESHHDFASERLRESGELDAMQKSHYDYFSSRRWEPVESANFWRAAGWGRDNAQDGGFGLALEIGDTDFADQTRAGKLILDLLESSKPSEAQRVEATMMAARLAWRQADHIASRRLAESAVSMARKVDDPELIARALSCAGLVYETAGELALAGQMYDEALSILSDSTSRRLLADVSNARGLLAITQGDPASALETLSPCVASARSQNDPPRMARYLESLANAQLDLGQVDEAAESWGESLSVFRVVHDWFGIIWSLIGLSLVAAARRQDDRALRLAGAADRLTREYSLTTWSFRAQQLEDARKQAHDRLGTKGRGEAAWKEGQTMTTAEALEYALGGDRPPEEGPTDRGLLSRREREVVTMVASGMTNKEIAQRLFIAERTAEGHVERIRNKLGVRSRTEVATWAVAHGLHTHPLDKPPPSSKV
ncbi:MAG TPA: LuxR C-terminal-related transcriptional regulator [Candidatus Dormibacteraeota bacterium]